MIAGSPYETKNLISSSNDVTMHFTNVTEMTMHRLETIPCDAVRNFQLFVLLTTENISGSASLAKAPIPQDWIGKFERCSRVFQTSLLVTNKSSESSTLGRTIFDAYLDNVDYFYVALYDERKEDLKPKLDLVKKREVLRRSPHEVGIVVDDDSISNVFFSKTHLEVFGSVFPVTIGDLGVSFDYLVSVYRSEHLAAFTSNNEEIFKISGAPPDAKSVTDERKGQYNNDILTLKRQDPSDLIINLITHRNAEKITRK